MFSTSLTAGQWNLIEVYTIRCLKDAPNLKKLKEGRILHAHIAVSVFKDDLVMHNTIINMYAKCGSLDDARKLFDVMPVKNMVTWTALITGYSQNDQPQNALVLFPQMLRIGLKPNQFTLFSSVLKASGTRPSDEFGKQVHAFCLKFGYDWNVYVGSSLLDMYARFGRMRDAWLIFNELESKNDVSWNALIAGHARKGEGEITLGTFSKMLRKGFEPTHFTYSSVFTALASTGKLTEMEQENRKRGREELGEEKKEFFVKNAAKKQDEYWNFQDSFSSSLDETCTQTEVACLYEIPTFNSSISLSFPDSKFEENVDCIWSFLLNQPLQQGVPND
ncbi:hypothetical protein Patl1_09635 [Pistacia atlantica]|uniref:Uncharacterized protein n=1 Tax=Pistacia atlantica TaxID=434234 RepID=A0ACC1A4R5_9ROSI|nr:hypothetical protein Patl1_09635 [Pistacia atlantica]